MPRKKSLAIAVALREAVHDGKTAALVTPDRALGRRVLAALGRWNIAAEDSGGDALAETPAGIFARLAAEAALGGLAPVTLLALLKHPLLRLGMSGTRDAVATLERAILRGPRPRAGSTARAGADASARAENISRDAKIRSASLRSAHALDRCRTRRRCRSRAAARRRRLAPLESLGRATAAAQRPRRAPSRRAGRTVGGKAKTKSHSPGRDGTKLADALDELAASKAAAGLSVDAVRLSSNCLPPRLPAASCAVPPQPGLRVRILGPLEARLTESDRVVLGGLVEGTWPPESRTDAWLSRPMRLELGLDLPERRIGLSAHDFAQLLGAREVILTHAAKIAGAPTVPSRFIQRLAAVAGERWQDGARHAATIISPGRASSTGPKRVTPEPQPAPKPPRAARPTSLSVTEIEHWLRDPYTIYAKHILRLTPLDPVDAEPGAAERGTVIHDAIGEFTQRFADKLPADPAGELHRARTAAFCRARGLSRGARLLVAALRAHRALVRALGNRARRAGIAAIAAEIRGEIDIPLDDGAFKLRGIADRIERDADGRYVILDYKTGAARTEKQVRTGLAPQLTLEAAMLRQGGFKDIAAGASVAELGYVLLKGGEPPGEPKPIEFKEGTPDSHADRALEKLTAAGQALRRCRRSPTARWCIRCGRPITATTTISRASRNGRAPAARPTTPEAANENAAASFPTSVRQLQREVSNPARLGVGRRQCRLGQDPCAGAARHQSFARRRRAGKNPLHHLHQGRRRQHGQARVRHARRMDHARRRRLDKAIRRTLEPDARRRAPRAGAAAVRARAGNAGRAEGADHPRFLHPAAASVSVRGQCRRALQRARRRRAHRSFWSN